MVSIAAVCLTFAILGVDKTMKHLDVITSFLEIKVNKELYVTLPKTVVLLEEPLSVGFDRQVHARLLKILHYLKQMIRK